MKKAFSHWFWSALLSGVLFATSYPPFPAWALFFSFVPLWRFWFHGKTLREVALAGFVANFALTIIGYNWVAHTANEYGHLPMSVSYFVLIAFCCFSSLNVALAGVSVWSFHQKFRLSAPWFFVCLAVASAAFEWIYPMIFPWNMGYPLLYSKFYSAQLAEFGGFAGLSLLVNLANACFAMAFEKFPQAKWSRPLLVFLIGLSGTEIYGRYLLGQTGIEDRYVDVLMVQPNIGNYDKFFAERGQGYQEPVVRKDFDITIKAFESISGVKPGLIVWPETAYPTNLDSYFKNKFYSSKLFDFAKGLHTPMITGAYSEDPPIAQKRRTYNAMFAIDENGEVQPAYRKYILLAFGEYVPGGKWIPFLKTIVPEISDFDRGDGPTAFKLGETLYSPLICYESIDTSYVNEVIKKGGQVMVNLANDSWYGPDFEPFQNMIMSVARTIEFRRPMIRATNTGVSVVADLRGQILTKGPQGTEWTGVARVPYFSNNNKLTLYSKILPYLTFIFLGLLVAVLIIGRVLSEKQRN